ncbi:MAG: RnfABCDGE type electron transport complex subunit D [Pseudomonadota bacterium]
MVLSNQQIMGVFCAALVPGTAAMTWLWGWGVVWNLAILLCLCAVIEVLCKLLRQSPVTLTTFDVSTFVTAWLIALCLPPATPVLVLASAAVASIALAKHVFGGAGHSLFNPAMVGYAVALVSFPELLASWPGQAVDGYSGATLLSEFRYREGRTVEEFFDSQASAFSDQRFIALCFAAGGLVIWRLGLIAWRTSVGVLAGVTLCAMLGYDGGASTSYGSPYFHWYSGGLLLATFFVVTDPATHPRGHAQQWLFGILVGVVVFVIRAFGSYPDGIAFAVLFANSFTPLLNRYAERRKHTPEVEANRV